MAAEKFVFSFHPDGRVTTLYDDRLGTLLRRLGTVEIMWASHVEPTSGGLWTADMGPVSGPVLGPFSTRGEALTAEREWLISHGTPTPGRPL